MGCGDVEEKNGVKVVCSKPPGHEGAHHYVKLEMQPSSSVCDFLISQGLPDTETMREHLTVWVRAAKIFKERTEDLGGELWREVDTSDTAHHVRHKAQRLYHREDTDRYDPDDPLDLINYAIFYIRQKED